MRACVRAYVLCKKPAHSCCPVLSSKPTRCPQDAARRRFAAEVAAENLRLMQEKKAAGARQAVEEQEAARRTVLQEGNW